MYKSLFRRKLFFLVFAFATSNCTDMVKEFFVNHSKKLAISSVVGLGILYTYKKAIEPVTLLDVTYTDQDGKKIPFTLYDCKKIKWIFEDYDTIQSTWNFTELPNNTTLNVNEMTSTTWHLIFNRGNCCEKFYQNGSIRFERLQPKHIHIYFNYLAELEPNNLEQDNLIDKKEKEILDRLKVFLPNFQNTITLHFAHCKKPVSNKCYTVKL